MVDLEVLAAVRALELDIPLVAVAATSRPDPQLVAIDQYRGARTAVCHLTESGHERIHISPGRPPIPTRLSAFADGATS